MKPDGTWEHFLPGGKDNPVDHGKTPLSLVAQQVGEAKAGKKPRLGPGMVDPAAAHEALEAAGWEKAKTAGSTNSYQHPDHPIPGTLIGLSDEGAWAHDRFNVKLPKGIPGTPAYPPIGQGGPG